MSEEFINYSYIEMLIQDLEENSLGYWNATQDEMAKSLRNLQQENQKLKIEISGRETVCNELQERINKASALLKEFYETGNIPLNNISKAYFELNGGSNESQR